MPLPALEAALAFLGQKVARERSVDALLAAAAAGFDASRIPPSAHAPVAFAALRKDA
jgi:hypothetical protein